MTVSPGVGYAVVVGAGGLSVTNFNNARERGKAGGSSSFGGILVANGGEGGYKGSFSDNFTVSYGGVAGTDDAGSFGGTGVLLKSQQAGINGTLVRLMTTSSFTLNVFELKLCLGSGAGGYYSHNIGGKNPLTGKGGGDIVVDGVGDGNASETGCGGGASKCAQGVRSTSGKGADGAVYLYARRIPV